MTAFEKLHGDTCFTVLGCHGLHVDTGRFGKGIEHCSRDDSVYFVCMSGSVEEEHYFLFDCPAYNHICQQYSDLFHQAPSSSSSVAAFLTTDQPNMLGSDLKTCFACRVTVLAPSSITASLLQLLWCSVVERL